MTFKEKILQELDSTPDPVLEQVFNFIRFLKTNQPTRSASIPEHPLEHLSDEERLVRINQVFGAWKDQPDLIKIFAEIDRERHAYRGRQIDSMDD